MNKDIKCDKYDKDGKMWSLVAEKVMTWSEALEYAKNLREGGYDDWRLPTIEELGELMAQRGKNSPFWISTDDGPHTCSIFLQSNSVRDSNKAYCYVRCIRG